MEEWGGEGGKGRAKRWERKMILTTPTSHILSTSKRTNATIINLATVAATGAFKGDNIRTTKFWIIISIIWKGIFDSADLRIVLYLQHATIENRLTNETIDLGIPNVDWNRYLIVFNSNTVFDSGSVYYLSVWYQTTYADSHGGLIKYEDKVWRLLQILFSSFNIRLNNFCLII